MRGLRETFHKPLWSGLLSPMRSLPRYSYFADCKLYIRTRLFASAYSNFWQTPLFSFFQ
ncbi:hypothetical protein IW261DRAFT_907599 [Armillaria novae-zelandiae]|uniref:Uncharacterized protein n=1 Tax=Armillaria novae-zelandiae TaxID=153914 RepID=A0AA39TZV4_9AGAR|nr:hypothetical protein IW261DRAFT_907599 [Armillaria novae-zelandiae]